MKVDMSTLNVFYVFGEGELTVFISLIGQISKIQNIISIVFEKWYVECFDQNELQKYLNSFENLY